jgi:hypothetical protein
MGVRHWAQTVIVAVADRPAVEAERTEEEAAHIAAGAAECIAVEASVGTEEPLYLRPADRSHHKTWRYPDFVYHNCYKT